MRVALFVLTLLTLNTSHAQSTAKMGFDLQYDVIRNKDKLGVAHMQLMPLANGTWQFSTQTTGTEGLASLTSASVSEVSDLKFQNSSWELRKNRLETKVAWKSAVKTTALQKDGKTYVYSDKNGVAMIPYSAGILDQHSLTLAVISDLRRQQGPALIYTAINKGKIETYTFRVMEKQMLNTAMGRLNTIRVDRIRQSSNGKSTQIWFAVDKNFMPVLIKENDSDGDDIEMRITAIN